MIVETISYIKTTACVEATRRSVWMFRLKNMSLKTTVTVRDREVGRDRGIFARRVGGIILEDDPVFAKTPPKIFLASNKTDVI